VCHGWKSPKKFTKKPYFVGARSSTLTPIKSLSLLLEAETLFAFECSMETANSPIFLKLGNAKDHQTLLNYVIPAGKWQKTHLFI